MAEAPGYPKPQEDADNRPMLQAWREGRLVVQRCAQCGAAASYPRPLCPHCWSDRLGFEEASGRGEIVAWSLVHRPNHESFMAETPLVLAEIALPEGRASSRGWRYHLAVFDPERHVLDGGHRRTVSCRGEYLGHACVLESCRTIHGTPNSRMAASKPASDQGEPS